MDFTPWTAFADLGLIALLLLGGQLVRAHVVVVQRLFLPANVLAGLAGLALGPNGADLLPFSAAISKYPGILIAFIFASLPFSSQTFSFKASRGPIGELCAYSCLTIFMQWGLGLLFALALLTPLWPDLHPGFGAMLVSGFVGGHGTAAAIGSAFAARGWEEAGSLAMTAATVGILGAIVGGMAWINWGAKRGAAHYLARFDELPQELRHGLIPPDKRPALGQQTIAPITLDPLVFHFALIAATAALGYFIGQWSAPFMGHYRLPTFCLAFLAAVAVKQGLKSNGALHYVDPATNSRLSGSLTDLLVAFGIASINVPILLKYAYPLAALFLFALLLCGLLFRLVGPRVFRQLWFEKSVYTWGWVTGIMAMAIALLRIVDPDNKSRILDDFALAYLVIGPAEVIMVTLTPLLVSQGHAWPLALAATGLSLLLLLSLLARRLSPNQKE